MDYHQIAQTSSLCPLLFFMEQHSTFHLAMKIEGQLNIRECQTLAEASKSTANLIARIEESKRIRAVAKLASCETRRPIRIHLKKSTIYFLRAFSEGKTICHQGKLRNRLEERNIEAISCSQHRGWKASATLSLCKTDWCFGALEKWVKSLHWLQWQPHHLHVVQH